MIVILRNYRDAQKINRSLESRSRKSREALIQIEGKKSSDSSNGTSYKFDLDSPEGLENASKILRDKAKINREAKLTSDERKRVIDEKCKEETEKKRKQRENQR